MQGVNSWTWHWESNPSQLSLPHPGLPAALSEGSGFNFLVSVKRRRKKLRRRRRKESVEALMQSAGICHSAYSPLTTEGSFRCKQPVIYGHRVNSCAETGPAIRAAIGPFFLAGDRACIFLIHAKLLCTAISSVLI